MVLLVDLVKLAALLSSGIFTGYTYALSNAAVPSILRAKTETQMVDQWRDQYLKGFRISRPLTIVNGLSFGYLAYAASASSNIRILLIIACLFTASGVPFAWTVLRGVNGALSIRSDKLAGPGEEVIALSYSRNEKWSKETEAKYSTKELVTMWKQYNELRSIFLVVGTVIGAWAIIQI